MLEKNDLQISLKKEIHESEFYYDLLKEEFQQILYNKDLRNNHINIYSSYVYEDEEYIEFGVYFINVSKIDIVLNTLPLAVYNEDNLIYKEGFEINKIVEGNSAIFKEIKVPKDSINNSYKISNLSIGIEGIRSIKKYPYINVEIKNLPKTKDYVNYRELKKFINNLPVIEEDELCIDIFRVGEIEEGFYIIALFRNSSNRNINIKSIPLTVENPSDLLIYKGVFTSNEDSLNILSNSGKIMVITIPRNEFNFVDGEDFSKYKVKIN